MTSLHIPSPTHRVQTRESRSIPLRVGALIAWAVGLLAILFALAIPLQAQTGQIPIADGSFEEGSSNPHWDEYSTNIGTPLTTGDGTRTGSWFGGFGRLIGSYEERSLSQDVTIDPGASDLTFWLEVPHCDSADDYMEVLIDGNQEFVVDGNSTRCGGFTYEPITLDLSGYADGGTHTLEFHSEAFGSNGNTSSFDVDDVGSVHHITLDEPCALGDFDIDSPANGGTPVELTCEGGVVNSGNVVGFHFIGDATGLTSSDSWASDTCMIVEAPGGDIYGVGGVSGTAFGAGGWCNFSDWAFQGSGSSADDTYESTHDYVFPEVDDGGTWTFTFINDWDNAGAGTISWSDVVVTLRKVPSVATEATPEQLADALTAPAPNPVHGTSTFTVAVETGQNVTVEVFDIMGRRVQTLYDAPLATGMAETLELDAAALPAGVYVIRATGEDFAKTRRVTVVR